MVAVLAEIDALPGAERQAPSRDRQAQAGNRAGSTLKCAWQIVRPS